MYIYIQVWKTFNGRSRNSDANGSYRTLCAKGSGLIDLEDLSSRTVESKPECDETMEEML